ncbi:hypothetical protein UFOVP411_3 [uncultured Caudovirales phage]|uniref:DUF5681 domain-containing protein n=1 Tax=uncultured Caudovirales phage TaxID=2100421 RepID=A0A6J5M699_9CAUD|nr:hypothetical protein UFOVP411_3 [uncultured Caudovirales phage]
MSDTKLNIPVFSRKGRGRPSKTEVAARESRPRGRPPGEAAKMAALRSALLESDVGPRVVQKVIEVAMNDEHPAQGAMLRLLMDRLAPVSSFETASNDQTKTLQVSITTTSPDGTTTEVTVGKAAPEQEDDDYDEAEVLDVAAREVDDAQP